MSKPMSQLEWAELAKQHERTKGRKSVLPKADKPSNNVPGDVPAPEQPTLEAKPELSYDEQLEAILRIDPGMHAPQLIHQVLNFLDRVMAAQLRLETKYLQRILALEEAIVTIQEGAAGMQDVLLAHLTDHDDQEITPEE